MCTYQKPLPFRGGVGVGETQVEGEDIELFSYNLPTPNPPLKGRG
jgi:hypothetical protein